jgi:short-subunit dehydrogenase
MKSLEDKIVLITGAGGGFGQAMIRQFLQAGSHLILSDLRASTLQQTAETIVAAFSDRAPPGRILGYIEADLSHAAGCDTLYQQCQAVSPFIDMLINNAGVAVYGLTSDVPQEKWEALMEINLLSPMRLTAKFLPTMIARRSGHVVNVSSMAGLVGTPGLSAYSAAKFGLRGFGETLYAELKPYNIDVTNIYPFFARTSILQLERFGEKMLRTIPDQMLYDPDFIVAELIKGIRKRKLHVFPGAIPKHINRMTRMMPWAMPLIVRLLERNHGTRSR